VGREALVTRREQLVLQGVEVVVVRIPALFEDANPVDVDEADPRLDQPAAQEDRLPELIASVTPLGWLVLRWLSERTTMYLSACRARCGRCSQTRMPGTLLAMGLNSPRISSGASGFMSKVSW
jgi:hypothetical protein